MIDQHDYLDFTGNHFIVLTSDGELCDFHHKKDILAFLQQRPAPIICHSPSFFKKSDITLNHHIELLTLITFVKPDLQCPPSITAISQAFGLDSTLPSPLLMAQIIDILYDELQQMPSDKLCEDLALMLDYFGWFWGKFLVNAMNLHHDADKKPYQYLDVLKIWKKYHQEKTKKPASPITSSRQSISGQETRDFLHQHLSQQQQDIRQQQSDYSTAIAGIFDHTPQKSLLVEAATGTGKTIGYLAPSVLWAKTNKQTVWISTYTRYLQHQAYHEATYFYDNDAITRQPPIIQLRKGRDNYLCLLNLEDMIARADNDPHTLSAAALLVRWYDKHRDGDFNADYFPAWLNDLYPFHMMAGLSDRQGECIHQACPHYDYCFIEQAADNAQHADIIITNHAYLLYQLQYAADGYQYHTPMSLEKLIIDEGHQLFHVADQFFARALTITTLKDMRQWIIGRKTMRQSRQPRGLAKKLEGLCDDEHQQLIAQLAYYSDELISDNALKNILSGQSSNSGEAFLMTLYQAIQHKVMLDEKADPYYSHEYALMGKNALIISQELQDTAHIFHQKLQNFNQLAQDLIKYLLGYQQKISQSAVSYREIKDSDHEKIIKQCEQAIRQIDLRLLSPLAAFITILEDLFLTPSSNNQIYDDKNNATIDWAALMRDQGNIYNIGVYRHLYDPMIAFATLCQDAGCDIAVTSATLTSASHHDIMQKDQEFARKHTGLAHYDPSPPFYHFTTPFDYTHQARIILINDYGRKKDDKVLAQAYGKLFHAANGGAMGVFTAILRLKNIYPHLKSYLESRQIDLYAQHIDAHNLANLIAMFKHDHHSCIIGTDALCDGVDVPGDSLRLIVAEHVPWVRSNFLHQQRRLIFGKKEYDIALTRLRLRQIFGRLVRTHDDKGVFVLLESRIPSDLLSAFPENVTIERLSLDIACDNIKEFLNIV